MAEEVTKESTKKAKEKTSTVTAVMANLNANSGVREVVGVVETINGMERTTLWAKGKEKKLSGDY